MGPRRVGPPEGWGAQNFALFSLPPQFSFFLLLGVFSGVSHDRACPPPDPPKISLFFSLLRHHVFEAPGPSNVHVWAVENSKRAHLRAPVLQTPPKFNEKTPKRRKKEKLWREREKKKRNFGRSWGGPLSTPPLHFCKYNQNNTFNYNYKDNYN